MKILRTVFRFHYSSVYHRSINHQCKPIDRSYESRALIVRRKGLYFMVIFVLLTRAFLLCTIMILSDAAYCTIPPNHFTIPKYYVKTESSIHSIYPQCRSSSGNLHMGSRIYRHHPLNASTNLAGAIQINEHSLLPPTYMLLLALQFAVQPLLTKAFAPKGIIRSTYVFAQDVVRLIVSVFLLTITKSWQSACINWSLHGSLITAGVSSILYLIQSYCSLIAYQTLSPITYNVLNQTKTISAAFFCYVLLRERQSTWQIVSLGILLLAALVMEKIIPMKSVEKMTASCNNTKLREEIQPNDNANKNQPISSKINTSMLLKRAGIIPILVASLISGLAGAWTQRSLRDTLTGSNSLFFSLQLSIYSIVSMICALLIPGLSSDRALLMSSNWFVGWTSKTWIPIIVNAVGGILVGLVTKTSGVVAKGFALILGMFLSGLLQNTFSGESVSKEQWVGGVLAAISVWMHTSFPYKIVNV